LFVKGQNLKGWFSGQPVKNAGLLPAFFVRSPYWQMRRRPSSPRNRVPGMQLRRKYSCRRSARTKEAAQEAASFTKSIQCCYWQGYILPSSSFVMVPGWQTKPLRVA